MRGTPRSRTLLILLALAAILVPQLDALHVTAAAEPPVSGRFVGADGQAYDEAPTVVEGANGQLFYGPDFDRACYLGKRVQRGMNRLTRLARAIRASGRQVVFTVAPNKTMVSKDVSIFPHGACDVAGFKAAAKVMDAVGDPSYLPMRRRLMADARQVYWHTDLHWTTVGGSVFSRAVAARLDPNLAKRQRYKQTTMTGVGNLNHLRNSEVPETVESVDSDTPVKVRATRRSPEWHGLPTFVGDYSWTSRPAHRTYPGRTALLGDSFTLYALNTLLPLFRHGRFVWLEAVPERTVLKAIQQSDTVVIEVLQLLLEDSTLTDPDFLEKVRHRLG